MNKNLRHILVLPRWYPNKFDIQLGIFIQRQLFLLKDDFRFTVVYAQMDDELNTKFKHIVSNPHPNITEHIIYFKTGKGITRRIQNFRNNQKALLIGIKKIKIPIDLCHVHVPYRTAIMANKLRKSQKIPFLITEHWSGHLNGKYKAKNYLDKYLYKTYLKKAAKTSTVSSFLQTAFRQNTGIKTIVIPNYIENSPLKNEIQSNPNQIKLLSVGDFDDNTKNITGLLNAFSAALKKNDKLHLTLVGGGPDEEKIKNHISALKIEADHLTLTGRLSHDKVLTEMQNCDFYICNSRYETFGMTIAEALICGKPVISTLCGGPNDFLNAENSIRIEPYYPELKEEWTPLRDAILTLSTSYQAYNSNEIINTVTQRFGAETVRKKWIDFYTK